VLISANIIEVVLWPLISALEAILVFFHKDIFGTSWGLAIAGLAVVVQTTTLPAKVRVLRSSGKTPSVAPKMMAIKEKYKDNRRLRRREIAKFFAAERRAIQEKYRSDPVRRHREIKKLYKENTPSLLALLGEVALLFLVPASLFYLLRVDLKKHICGSALSAHGIVTSKAIQKATCGQVAPHSVKFLFVPDITAKATGAVLIALVVLVLASEVIPSLIIKEKTNAKPITRWIHFGLLLVVLAILSVCPAGILVYWIAANLLWIIVRAYLALRGRGTTRPPTASEKPRSPRGPSSSRAARGSPKHSLPRPNKASG
jgi:membrane protein insertase Oxa1/YidC/SpoIIIJ